MNFKVLILIIFLLLLLSGIILLKLFSTSSKPSPSLTPIISPIPSSQTQNLSPTSTPQPNTGYFEQGLDKNYQRISSGMQLSTNDQVVYKKITASLSGNSDILVKTTTFQIKYVNPPNEFLVEILNNSADQGKQDAVNWLKIQGFSNSGICNLKMVIYLNSSIKSYYQQNNLQFNPIPDGC